MFDIIQSANELFGVAASSCREILPELIFEYRVIKQNLPAADELIVFLGQKPERDKIAITITSDTGSTYVGTDVVWAENYEAFRNALYDDDEIAIVIKVTKGIENGKQSIYNLKEFSNFLCNLKPVQLFEIFTKLFKDCGEHIAFQLLNTNGSLKSRSIVFSDNDVEWPNRRPREELIKDCHDASVFLERERIRVIPQDFEIDGLEGNGFEDIKKLFEELQIILSYFYLANTATVVDDRVVLQFDPTDKGFEYEFDELTKNSVINRIFDWAFQGDSCVDKAGIARKIINTYCRDKESILSIDERVLNSIKSDYVIYQKNHVDQYIDMKNKISDYIVDSADKIQDLSHDIIDAFRNNFVAVIVFLMTVLLTDSIDFTQFLGKEISPKVTAVCGVFTVATLLYFIATIIMGNQKWQWLKQSYDDLKNNYDGVFDTKDIEDAFNHDKPLKHAEEQYKSIRCKICGIWIALIVVMCVFTGVLIWQGNHVSTEIGQQIEGQICEENPTESVEGSNTQSESVQEENENVSEDYTQE